jgi:DNA polymerase-3 subunit delta'
VCDDFVGDFRTLLLESGYFDIEDWYRTIGVETKQGMIYEKESSEILRKLSLKSFGNGYKVMIIWQPEKMNAVCANKLLKLLEEPPERTVFLLVSEHPEMLLTTILSRVQQVMVPRLDDQDIADALVRDGVDQQSAADLARIANGSYLAARQMAREQDETQRYLADFIALMRDAYTVGVITDRQKKFDSLQRLRKWSLDMSDSKVGRERQKNFLQYAQRQVRENFIRNFQTPELNYQTADERAFSDRFFPYINMGNVEAIVEQLSLAEQQIQQNGNAKMIFFDLCLQMIVLIKKKQ